MQVVLIKVEAHHLWNGVSAGPLRSKDIDKCLQILESFFSDSENAIAQPSDTDWCQLVIEELFPELPGKDWELVNDRELDSPILVLTQLSQSWNDALRQVLNSDDVVQRLDPLEEVEPHVGALVSKQCQKDG